MRAWLRFEREREAREERARDWELTALMTLAVAAVPIVLAAFSTPRWPRGEIVVGIYFGLFGAGMWLYGSRVRFASHAPDFTLVSRLVLIGGFVVGLALTALDVGSHGRL